MKEKLLTLEELRALLLISVGSNYPVRITKKNSQIAEGYIRGWADSQHNIILISEKSDSMSMGIIDIKNIDEVICPALYQDESRTAMVLRTR